MKALQHWLEVEGHAPKSTSTLFDEEFTRQCLERGRIEDSEVVLNFLKTTKQDVWALLKTGWLGTLIRRMNHLDLLKRGRVGAFLARAPVVQGLKMGWLLVFKPRTRSWGRTGEVLREYVEEQRRLAHAKA
jgi:heterodisulfide reductase subunit C